MLPLHEKLHWRWNTKGDICEISRQQSRLIYECWRIPYFLIFWLIHSQERCLPYNCVLIERSELLFLSYLLCHLLLIFVYISLFYERFHVTSNVQVLSYPVPKYLCLIFSFSFILFLTSWNTIFQHPSCFKRDENIPLVFFFEVFKCLSSL